jgi:hypothetical protein
LNSACLALTFDRTKYSLFLVFLQALRNQK